MTGFPDPALNQLREKLRIRFKACKLQHSIYAHYTLKTVHSTVMRFGNQLDNKSALLEFVEKHKNTDIGFLRVGNMELAGNDWYQRKQKTVTIGTFNLAKK
ncbi:MAG: hypothetical protein R8G66_07905 [Cytophagales bacterium]|nr:hypothetical protein [Cytophagales bacterium]